MTHERDSDFNALMINAGTVSRGRRRDPIDEILDSYFEPSDSNAAPQVPGEVVEATGQLIRYSIGSRSQDGNVMTENNVRQLMESPERQLPQNVVEGGVAVYRAVANFVAQLGRTDSQRSLQSLRSDSPDLYQAINNYRDGALALAHVIARNSTPSVGTLSIGSSLGSNEGIITIAYTPQQNAEGEILIRYEGEEDQRQNGNGAVARLQNQRNNNTQGRRYDFF
jgi:hypothetical protein